MYERTRISGATTRTEPLTGILIEAFLLSISVVQSLGPLLRDLSSYKFKFCFMAKTDIGVKTGTQTGLANNPQMGSWIYKTIISTLIYLPT